MLKISLYQNFCTSLCELKWLRPADYCSTDFPLYATNRALAALGSELNINFAHVA